jgi:hypothetical protein
VVESRRQRLRLQIAVPGGVLGGQTSIASTTMTPARPTSSPTAQAAWALARVALRRAVRQVAGRSDFRAVDAHRRATHLRVVEAATPTWTAPQREMVAAAPDVLWNPPSYGRLVGAWHMDSARAITTLRWLIDIVSDSIREDQPPDG